MEISLERLEKIKLIAQKENRTTDLLADFSTDYARGLDGQVWYFCVPKFFYEALDIKYTTRIKNKVEEKIWTQGSWFKFSEGDKLYNHAYAYCNNFIGGLFSIHSKICLSIESARPSLPRIKIKYKKIRKATDLRNSFRAAPFLKKNILSGVIKGRYPGQINFKIMIKNPATNVWETQGNESLSQDEFITLLIKGPPQEWKIF
jgi:hypothetical protein